MGLGQRAMKSGRFLIVRLVLPALVTALFVVSCKDEKPQTPVAVARQPRITPDYAGIVIPPNIAPLNFTIDEPGDRYIARIHSTVGRAD